MPKFNNINTLQGLNSTETSTNITSLDNLRLREEHTTLLDNLQIREGEVNVNDIVTLPLQSNNVEETHQLINPQSILEATNVLNANADNTHAFGTEIQAIVNTNLRDSPNVRTFLQTPDNIDLPAQFAINPFSILDNALANPGMGNEILEKVYSVIQQAFLTTNSLSTTQIQSMLNTIFGQNLQGLGTQVIQNPLLLNENIITSFINIDSVVPISAQFFQISPSLTITVQLLCALALQLDPSNFLSFLNNLGLNINTSTVNVFMSSPIRDITNLVSPLLVNTSIMPQGTIYLNAHNLILGILHNINENGYMMTRGVSMTSEISNLASHLRTVSTLPISNIPGALTFYDDLGPISPDIIREVLENTVSSTANNVVSNGDRINQSLDINEHNRNTVIEGVDNYVIQRYFPNIFTSPNAGILGIVTLGYTAYRLTDGEIIRPFIYLFNRVIDAGSSITPIGTVVPQNTIIPEGIIRNLMDSEIVRETLGKF